MLFKNITILDEDFNVRENMYVGTFGSRIRLISDKEPEYAEKYGEVYDGKDRLLMPGFYNAHGHSPMALMRGYGENLKLQDWLETRIFPFEAKLDSNAVYWGTLLCIMESLRFGIVSTQDMYYFTSDMVRAVADSGAKNNISRSLTNFDGTPFEQMESVREMKDAVRNYHGAEEGRILIDASLHAEYTSDEQTARGLAAYAKEEGIRFTCMSRKQNVSMRNARAAAGVARRCGIWRTAASSMCRPQRRTVCGLKEKIMTS